MVALFLEGDDDDNDDDGLQLLAFDGCLRCLGLFFGLCECLRCLILAWVGLGSLVALARLFLAGS